MYSMAGGGVSRAICWEREGEPESQQGEEGGRLEGGVATEGTAVVMYSGSTKCGFGLPKYHRNRSKVFDQYLYYSSMLVAGSVWTLTYTPKGYNISDQVALGRYGYLFVAGVELGIEE